MIINALYDLYVRLRNDPQVEIDIPGLSKAKVSFELVISEAGELKGVNDIRKPVKNKLFPVEMMVPQQNIRKSGDNPYLLCDKAEYMLGLAAKKNSSEAAAADESHEDAEGHAAKNSSTEAAIRRFRLCGKLHEEVLHQVEVARPVILFFKNWEPEQAEYHPALSEMIDEIRQNGNLVFRLTGESVHMHAKASISAAAGSHMEGAVKVEDAFCLVSGEFGPVQKVHPSIKGVKNAQTMGAALVSFNCGAFTSYGKEQSVNAPISVDAARGYVAALNWLLADRKHKVIIGDATTVFWAEALKAESLMSKLFSQDFEEDRQDAESTKVRDQLNDILTRLSHGQYVSEDMLGFDPGTKVYILGLSPNNSRLSVRFWHRDTFASMIQKTARHYIDMSLIRQSDRQEAFIPLPRIFKEMAPRGDMENLPGNLTGGLMRAILTSGPYPEGVYAAIIERIRANDGGKDAKGNSLNPVNYVRTSMIKAVLTRKSRIHNNTKEDCLTMSLNQSSDTAYRLGRLFALLEKSQQDANPGINSTIRDRYFGTASASPASVFPILLRLNQHHIKKAEYGSLMDRRIQDVMVEINVFPGHLNLEQQGKFMLGYYHQRQDLYTKKNDVVKGEDTNEGNN